MMASMYGRLSLFSKGRDKDVKLRQKIHCTGITGAVLIRHKVVTVKTRSEELAIFDWPYEQTKGSAQATFQLFL